MPAGSGLVARKVAATAVHNVLEEKRTFEDAFERAAKGADLPPRDRAFARAIAGAVLRRRGELQKVLDTFLEKPLPAQRGRLNAILLGAAAQLLILATPPHAAISLAVEQCRADRGARRFDRLANAVLRRVSEKGSDIRATLDGVALNIPPWLLARWQKAYGSDSARRIAEASLTEAPLDISVKSDPTRWAETLGGIALPTGSVRIADAGRIENLPGFTDGGWWVQDAAAAIPARLFGDVAGLEVADICAAPGGKTAQLANAGARVTALDQSAERLVRLEQNLARLALKAETVVADAAQWSPDRAFDCVLVDAPCTATGTIRRHPDILHLKRPEDLAALVELQARILRQASAAVKPGGQLVYCTCSLEPEEGVEQIAAFLAANPGYARKPVSPGECGLPHDWITPEGDVRTLPVHIQDLPEGKRGIDGFFIARLVRQTG